MGLEVHFFFGGLINNPKMSKPYLSYDNMPRESQKIYQRLIELVQPLINSFGLYLWGIEVPTARGGVLRVYIDSLEGVTVDQCAEVSKHLNILLDVEDPLPGPYTLEVSSPGMERQFFSIDQLQDYVGNRLFLQLKEPVQGSKKWRGDLLKTEENTIFIQTQQQKISFPWSTIKKIHLIYER